MSQLKYSFPEKVSKKAMRDYKSIMVNQFDIPVRIRKNCIYVDTTYLSHQAIFALGVFTREFSRCCYLLGDFEPAYKSYTEALKMKEL